MMKYILSLILLIAIGCSKDEPGPITLSDRQLALNSIGNNVMIRSFLDLQNSVNSLKEYANSYLSDSTNEEKLLVLRNEWTKATVSWKLASLFVFGPVDDEFVSTGIYSPADVAGIENVLSKSGVKYDPEYIRSLGIGYKGFVAIEYLLYGNRKGDIQTIINLFKTGGGQRASYLKALCLDLKEHTDTLLYKWSTGGEGYLNTFLAADGNNRSSSLAIIVDRMLKLVAVIKDTRIGAPNGLNNSGVAQPELVELKFSSESKALLFAELQSIEYAFTGTKADNIGAKGINLLLDKAEAKSGNMLLSDKIADQFASIYFKLNLIKVPLEQAVISNQTLVSDVYIEVGKLQVLMQEDMMGYLNFKD